MTNALMQLVMTRVFFTSVNKLEMLTIEGEVCLVHRIIS